MNKKFMQVSISVMTVILIILGTTTIQAAELVTEFSDFPSIEDILDGIGKPDIESNQEKTITLHIEKGDGVVFNNPSAPTTIENVPLFLDDEIEGFYKISLWELNVRGIDHLYPHTVDNGYVDYEIAYPFEGVTIEDDYIWVDATKDISDIVIKLVAKPYTADLKFTIDGDTTFLDGTKEKVLKDCIMHVGEFRDVQLPELKDPSYQWQSKFELVSLRNGGIMFELNFPYVDNLDLEFVVTEGNKPIIIKNPSEEQKQDDDYRIITYKVILPTGEDITDKVCRQGNVKEYAVLKSTGAILEEQSFYHPSLKTCYENSDLQDTGIQKVFYNSYFLNVEKGDYEDVTIYYQAELFDENEELIPNLKTCTFHIEKADNIEFHNEDAPTTIDNVELFLREYDNEFVYEISKNELERQVMFELSPYSITGDTLSYELISPKEDVFIKNGSIIVGATQDISDITIKIVAKPYTADLKFTIEGDTTFLDGTKEKVLKDCAMQAGVFRDVQLPELKDPSYQWQSKFELVSIQDGKIIAESPLSYRKDLTLEFVVTEDNKPVIIKNPSEEQKQDDDYRTVTFEVMCDGSNIIDKILNKDQIKEYAVLKSTGANITKPYFNHICLDNCILDNLPKEKDVEICYNSETFQIGSANTEDIVISYQANLKNPNEGLLDETKKISVKINPEEGFRILNKAATIENIECQLEDSQQGMRYSLYWNVNPYNLKTYFIPYLEYPGTYYDYEVVSPVSGVEYHGVDIKIDPFADISEIVLQPHVKQYTEDITFIYPDGTQEVKKDCVLSGNVFENVTLPELKDSSYQWQSKTDLLMINDGKLEVRPNHLIGRNEHIEFQVVATKTDKPIIIRNPSEEQKQDDDYRIITYEIKTRDGKNITNEALRGNDVKEYAILKSVGAFITEPLIAGLDIHPCFQSMMSGIFAPNQDVDRIPKYGWSNIYVGTSCTEDAILSYDCKEIPTVIDPGIVYLTKDTDLTKIDTSKLAKELVYQSEYFKEGTEYTLIDSIDKVNTSKLGTTKLAVKVKCPKEEEKIVNATLVVVSQENYNRMFLNGGPDLELETPQLSDAEKFKPQAKAIEKVGEVTVADIKAAVSVPNCSEFMVKVDESSIPKLSENASEKITKEITVLVVYEDESYDELLITITVKPKNNEGETTPDSVTPTPEVKPDVKPEPKPDINPNAWAQSENGQWARYDANGQKVIDWLQEGNNWYFFNQDGSMQTGWVHVNGKWYSLRDNGQMKRGWEVIDGKHYFFRQNGQMAESEWMPYNEDWYYIKASGAMAQNEWEPYNGAWYYFKADGKMAKNEKINGYKVDASGRAI